MLRIAVPVGRSASQRENSSIQHQVLGMPISGACGLGAPNDPSASSVHHDMPLRGCRYRVIVAAIFRGVVLPRRTSSKIIGVR